MLYVLEDAINGILIGSIYGLTAMGLTVIFGVLKVINFAHGSFLMVGMYVAYWAVTLSGIHPYLALAIVAPVMYLFGFYMQDIIIKPIFKVGKKRSRTHHGHHRHDGCLVCSGQPVAARFWPPIPQSPG